MRRSARQTVIAGVVLALAGAGVASAAAETTTPSADPCTVTSALAEPAECASGSSPASAVPQDPSVVASAVAEGDAFVDGLVLTGGGTLAKLIFPPGNMTEPVTLDADATNPKLFGYDFTPDGQTLYAVNNDTSTLVVVDQATGATTTVGPMTKPAGDNWMDVTIDPVTGAAYAGSLDPGTHYTLYRLDLATGATAVVNTVATTSGPIDLAINCAGDMYAEAILDDQLYRVDRATGALTLVGPLGVNINFAQGMDFDNATGALHAWLYSGGGAMAYSRLDLGTGAATPFPGTEPAGEFEGAIRSQCPPPRATISSGPSGKTAQLRPAFGFSTPNAATVQCSVDQGAPFFVPCTSTFTPAAPLTAGSWTFRVRASRGALSDVASQGFIVVDCATLKADVASATKAVVKAKKKLKKAKKHGDPRAVAKAKAGLKAAKQELRSARAELAAEPICGG